MPIFTNLLIPCRFYPLRLRDYGSSLITMGLLTTTSRGREASPLVVVVPKSTK